MIRETWYVLFGGTSTDGRGSPEFVCRTTNGFEAFRWFNKQISNTDSIGYVDIISDTGIKRATSVKDFDSVLTSVALRMREEMQKRYAGLKSDTCRTCRGEGEIGGQFCGGGYEKCPDCNGTGIQHERD